jgi:Retrotransposon gag protein/Zinc knuckle
MFNWRIQQRLHRFHNLFHTAPERLTQYQRNHFNLYQDPSCIVCHPPPVFLSARFLAFRNWFSLDTSLYSYTQQSVNCFRELLVETDPNRIEPRLDTLLKTLRFRQIEQRDILINLLNNCLQYTQRFTINLEQLNNLQNLDAPTNSEESEDNPDEPEEGMNNHNVGQLLGYLNQLVQQQNIRYIEQLPVFSGGDQDPVEWLDEFNRCAEVNGYEIGDKLNIVRGYLKNEAQTWLDQIEGNHATRFQSWQQIGNRNFEQAFITRFRNPGRLLQWRMELNNKLQQPHETVHQYAQAIRKLIKKADTEGRMTESEKVFHFSKGLRREIAAQVTTQLTFQPNATLEQMIEAASQIENHGKLYPETLVGFYSNPQVNQYQRNNYLPLPAPPAQNPLTNESVLSILQALGNLNLNQQSHPQSNNVDSYNQNNNFQRQRQPRNPPTCYKCRQPGHIARNCPTNQPVVNNPNPMQPTVQAFAHQVPLQQANMQPQYQMPPQQQQPQNFQIPQYQPPPQQPATLPVNNIPRQQNNPGGNAFVATEGLPVQQPQAQVYPVQHLNEYTHL